MKVCGIELTGNEAIICMVLLEDDIFHLPDSRVTRIKCENPDRPEDLRYFQKTVAKLVEDYKIEQVVIKARQKKGKFSGGADGFKLEAVIQLIETVPVSLMQATEQKENLKRYPLPIPFSEMGLKKYQEPAFLAAFSYIGGQYKW